MPGVDRRSRTATDEDGGDQIGYETPRSGVATPQPDPQDKRLPGIMSYFGQVRHDPPPATSTESTEMPPSVSVTFPSSFSSLRAPHEGALPSVDSDSSGPGPCGSDSASSADVRSKLAADKAPSRGQCSAGEDRFSQADSSISSQSAAQKSISPTHPYPTPPASLPSSSEGLPYHKHRSGTRSGPAPSSSSSTIPPTSSTTKPSEPDSLMAPSKVSEGSSQSCPDHQTNPHPEPPAQAPHSIPSQLSDPTDSQASGKWFTFDGIKELTRGVFKSGPPTPTRALSAAQPSHQESKGSHSGSSNDGAEKSGTQTPRGSATGAQAPVPKGRLTIKIPEARGLKKSRDPYVVVVFQRSELISGGPRALEGEEDDHLSVGTPGMGGVAIQRQGSDSGRPPVSIPMRSRQSSNTSATEPKPLRNRSARTSFTNPKWDAEALFDVVDSDMLVDISVYNHSATGEEFLGHVSFQASKEPDELVKGWYALQGNADTMIEDAPTGEIYVEASYQGSEKKHFGPSDFEILKLIGKGTFGQVYQVRKKDTKRIYAMKVLQKKVIVQKKEVAHTVGERNILVRTALADSPFIVGLKFSFQTPSELYLVTDYMSGGELFWHLQKEGRFDERRAKFYIAELILAIQHLHNSDIVYRDLKPENILLDANGHIALCDFGLSKANLTKNDTTNTFCGTTEYLAPEVLLDESGYTKMVDFWSLGVLVFEMCCGWSPFYAEDTQQMYKNIAFGKVRFPRDTLSQEGRNFVKGLLNRNPKHRLGATNDAEELKQHAFFGDIDWTLLSKKLITPPFRPKLTSETDVSYFDPEFTTALDQNGSLNERAAAMARGYAASTPLSPSVQANFQGFTFVDESALEDHMRDRPRMDDEDMDDARSGDDDDWDNLDDIDPRKTNRMSGIMKSSAHDEHMVGGAHFDV